MLGVRPPPPPRCLSLSARFVKTETIAQHCLVLFLIPDLGLEIDCAVELTQRLSGS